MSTTPAPVRLALIGGGGRLGQAVQRLAPEQGVEVVTAPRRGEDLEPPLAQADVLLDISAPDATVPLLEQAAPRGLPTVVGTTGHDAEQHVAIEAFADRLPLLVAGNFSLGIALLEVLAATAARALNDDFAPELVEAHHRHKKDAPSGTALALAEAVRLARGWSPEALKAGRSGLSGPRPAQEIGLHAIRGGEIAGDHTLLFAGPEEVVELRHRALDRALFARGALVAVRWIVDRPAGLYRMRDALGLPA